MECVFSVLPKKKKKCTVVEQWIEILEWKRKKAMHSIRNRRSLSSFVLFLVIKELTSERTAYSFCSHSRPTMPWRVDKSNRSFLNASFYVNFFFNSGPILPAAKSRLFLLLFTFSPFFVIELCVGVKLNTSKISHECLLIRFILCFMF